MQHFEPLIVTPHVDARRFRSQAFPTGGKVRVGIGVPQGSPGGEDPQDFRESFGRLAGPIQLKPCCSTILIARGD